MNKIHPLATVHPGAKLGDNGEVGPYAYIDDNVEIGDGCHIYPHATIFPYTRLGTDCNVFPGAVIGAVPQDLKFDGEITYVEIGDRVNIRECATINRGTKASGTGREGGTWSYEVFLEPKNVAVSLGGHHIPHWGA